MNPNPAFRSIARFSAGCLVVFPALFILVFLMHFGHLADFLHFTWHYTPPNPARIVPRIIAYHNRGPMIHDPHLLGFLALPVLALSAVALLLAGWSERPRAAAAAALVTVSGTIYMGGVFAMWIAFYRGLGDVDPVYTQGAIATFAAMTGNKGAFLFITTLARLTMVGFALQMLVLAGRRVVPLWAIVCGVAGCGLFLLFWDQDNWMLLASLLLLAGFIPVTRQLRSNNPA